MNFIVKNWSKMWQSLAVILPLLVLLADTAVKYFIGTEAVPDGWLPIAMIVSGYLGRIIKQPKL